MKRRIACAALLCAVALPFASCRNGGDEGGLSQPTAVNAVAKKLLTLHHLDGRQPETLTKEEREAEVDPAALDELVADRSAHDPFIGDLYVGFVVGALARHQGRWVTTVEGDKAAVSAGDVLVAFVKKSGAWKIDLAASIPAVIKTRAADEKKRYEAAKAAGEAMR